MADWKYQFYKDMLILQGCMNCAKENGKPVSLGIVQIETKRQKNVYTHTCKDMDMQESLLKIAISMAL